MEKKVKVRNFKIPINSKIQEFKRSKIQKFDIFQNSEI